MLKEQDDRSQLTTWFIKSEEIVRQVAEIIKMPPSMAIAEKTISEIDRDAINIAIVGSPNTGKSSLVNQIVDRQLLPTGVLPDDSVVYVQGSDDTAQEGFGLKSNPTDWHPLESFGKDTSPSASADDPLIFSLNDDWLKRHKFCLIEMPPLDMEDEAVANALAAFTGVADCLLLITDATAPMRRNEVKLLEASAKQSIPTVVVLAKMDRLLEEERSGIVDYVSKFAQACDSKTPVMPFSNRTAETQSNTQMIRAVVEQKVGDVDIFAGRTKRIAYMLTHSIETVSLSVKAALNNWHNRQQDTDIQARQHEIDVQNLEWQRIKQKLNNRRRKVDSMLKAQLQSNHANILDGLLYELDTTDNFREWWRRDFTARLAQEIQQTSEQITAAINHQAISDIEWLQAEAQKQFEFPLEDFGLPDARVNTIPVPQKSLVVSDENLSNIIARIGAAAAAILARVLGPRVGIQNAEMAAGAIAGIATEQLILKNLSQERSKIRDELSATIKQVERAYISESTRQLEESYSQIVADLQQQQSRWQQSQAASIKAFERGADGNSKADLQQLLDHIKQLKAEIEAVL